MGKKKEQGYIGTVKLGPKGQIVIPKEVRDMFDVEPGDSMVLMATPSKGIALQKQSVMLKIASAILGGGGKAIYPSEEEADLEQFAQAIKENVEEETE